jgi:hypothetical protein
VNVVWAQMMPVPPHVGATGSPGISGSPTPAVAPSPVTLPLVLAFGAIFLLISLVVAVQARRRGYPFLVWLVAGALGNSIFLLILLGIMPDFRRKNMRKKEMDELDERLLLVPRRLPGVEEISPPPDGLADRQGTTQDFQGRSLKGQVTTDLPQRSLGDEPTRL